MIEDNIDRFFLLALVLVLGVMVRCGRDEQATLRAQLENNNRFIERCIEGALP